MISCAKPPRDRSKKKKIIITEEPSGGWAGGGGTSSRHRLFWKLLIKPRSLRKSLIKETEQNRIFLEYGSFQSS